MRKKIIVRAPALSSSGYGQQSLFALRSLRKHQDKFDIYLLNVGWGRTGWRTPENEERQWIDELIKKTQIYFHEHNNTPPTFDVSLQITVPNEFEKIANFNVGYTAGIETTKVSPEWIQKAMLMDKLIVPSMHSKNTFEQTHYKMKVSDTQEVEVKNQTPIDVISYPIRISTPKELDLQLESSFNFLSVAQWGPRKNIESTISAFLGEFFKEPDVGLILKLNMQKNCHMDKIATEGKLNNFIESICDGRKRKCKIYFVHGNMTDEEMAGLYTHPTVKAFISTTHGEGFGLPLFEAVCNGLPVIAPAWSGHVDFLYAPKKDKDTGKLKMKPFFTKIEYDITSVQKDAVWPGVVQEDSQWCFIKNFSAREAMKHVYKNHIAVLSQAKKLKEYIVQELPLDKQYDKFVTSILSVMPERSIEDDKFNQIESDLKERNILDEIIGL